MHTVFGVAAIALLASIVPVSAHVRILTAYGNNDTRIHSGALGHLYQFPAKDYGSHQHPGQFDVAVFSDPIVPACCASPFKPPKFPRKWMKEGCGANLNTVFNYYAKTRGRELSPPGYNNNPDLMWKHRNYHFFMKYVPEGGYIQTKAETMKYANQGKHPTFCIYIGKMAKATPGGWVEMVTWQVNDDGAGPFRCRIDETGTGTNFGDTWATVVKQPPGEKSKGSINPWTNKQHHLLRVALPKGIKCSAEYGKYKNICMLRCENYAPNGPFGGCMPFQVIYPPDQAEVKPTPSVIVPPPTNEPEPKPDYGDAGYDVGNNNYQDGDYGTDTTYINKREIQKKKTKRGAAARFDKAALDDIVA
ncbi:hypothetical protein TWF718_009371 [Orbilia javanica]|uniref:Uncharacterized protein n=1 Tax=Orbilia javanica TaxID=47235 RepID=A0AAN8MZM6_9PEZI